MPRDGDAHAGEQFYQADAVDEQISFQAESHGQPIARHPDGSLCWRLLSHVREEAGHPSCLSPTRKPGYRRNDDEKAKSPGYTQNAREIAEVGGIRMANCIPQRQLWIGCAPRVADEFTSVPYVLITSSMRRQGTLKPDGVSTSSWSMAVVAAQCGALSLSLSRPTALTNCVQRSRSLWMKLPTCAGSAAGGGSMPAASMRCLTSGRASAA